MGSPLLARASRLPRALDTRTQILAVGRADRQCLRRSEPVLLLPADRRIRELRVTKRFEINCRFSFPRTAFGIWDRCEPDPTLWCRLDLDLRLPRCNLDFEVTFHLDC